MIHNKIFYQRAFKEFGVSAQGVHWNSKDSQYKRFEILTQFFKNDIEDTTIVDVGSGFGEYLVYLENNSLGLKEYIGVDCEDHMIEIAKKRFPNNRFYKRNILFDPLFEADYYICSGALNILLYSQVELFIKRCFQSSKKGFIFNYLKHLTFTNISQDEIIYICKEHTNNITVKENYLENDFTVAMFK